MIECIETRYGTMYVPASDMAQNVWLRLGGASPEDRQIDAVRELLEERPRGIVVDVGANFGVWSLGLQDVAAKVMAFEPQHRIAEILRKSVAERKTVTPIAIHELAVGSAWGWSRIADVPLDVGLNFGGVALETGYSGCDMVDVEVVSLDSMIGVGEHVSFIKIDVEGMEIPVLKGAAQTIARCRPIMIVEFWRGEDTENNPQPLVDYLASLGYAMEQMEANFLCVPMGT